MEKLSKIWVHDLSTETLEAIYNDLNNISCYEVNGKTDYYKKQHYENKKELNWLIESRKREK